MTARGSAGRRPEPAAPPGAWELRDRRLPLGGRTLLMGVLNVTPDSFSDGGLHADPDRAVEWGMRMAADGADLLDVGGESTRPGAAEIPAGEEARRVVPVVRALRARLDIPIAVDTRKAAVAAQALAAGADIVNDVSALGDPDMAGVVRGAGAGLVLMHMQGVPGTMQRDPRYADVAAEVAAFLSGRVAAAAAAGIDPGRLVVDPGIGFGKTAGHNLVLLAQLDRLRAAVGRPLLVGVSRKSLLGSLTGRPVGERLAGSLALLACLCRAGVDIARVHDVRESFDVVRVLARMAQEEAQHGLA